MAKPQPGTWHADPARFRPTRRDLIRVGCLGGLGLTLGSVLKLEAAARDDDRAQTIKPKATSVIHIYLQGGFPHMDSFDPKPDAPAEYRGILGAIETRLPGVRFSSHMKHLRPIESRKSLLVRREDHTHVVAGAPPD
jgi:hypothetical protein